MKNVFLKILSIICFLIIVATGSYVSFRILKNIAPKTFVRETSNMNLKSPSGTVVIPQKVYKNTLPFDRLYNVIHSDKKVVYYAFVNSPSGNSKNFNIRAGLDKENLNYYYNLYPDNISQNQNQKCRNKSEFCAQNYLIKNCTDYICIIHPLRREFIKIPFENYSEFINMANKLKLW